MRDAQVLDPAARRRSADAPVLPAVTSPPDDAVPRETTEPKAPEPVAPAPRRNTAAPTPGTGTDRRTQVRLRRGQLEIDARIDLHGRTQQQARLRSKRSSPVVPHGDTVASWLLPARARRAPQKMPGLCPIASAACYVSKCRVGWLSHRSRSTW